MAYEGDVWAMDEPELSDAGWLPVLAPNPSHREEIRAAMIADVNSDFDRATFLADNYFAGKGLHKFALVCLVADSLGETNYR